MTRHILYYYVHSKYYDFHCINKSVTTSCCKWYTRVSLTCFEMEHGETVFTLTLSKSVSVALLNVSV